ncbi:26S proteasome non-ATPase regulatory subunit 9, putative [Plasmodium ovale]|uniref:Proteasome regulatory protein, putative n=2 Tax=Plasmodium ovale TaxID=36330 RepID=A0A1A8W8A0_PLAOA|nr:proteasome regulatory protein, putative [Plasmodium ovale curtisi]SBS89242.1 proteasome regulatory protein, putative [Plasmodium ovale curtisi]SCP04213.1 26S proteasome non-ATPase regulatory subunit 9, putative [Plasmodium ovale]
MDLNKFRELVKRREDIENEINENLNFLKKPENKNIGMDGKLVDAEGFPRNDIDIYSIRVARNKIICLKNDYLDVNKEIEEYLHTVHNSQPAIRVERNRMGNVNGNTATLISDVTNGNHIHGLDTKQEQTELTIEELVEMAKRNVFAEVDEIVENSPSHKAGLRVNDHIFQFGDVKKEEKDNNTNVDMLKLISNFMKNNPSKIEIKIVRENKIYVCNIFPEKTSNGLYIGCHLTPT